MPTFAALFPAYICIDSVYLFPSNMPDNASPVLEGFGDVDFVLSITFDRLFLANWLFRLNSAS